MSAFAETDENGLTPKHWYKFNGNLNSIGETALTFGGEKGDSYVYSQRDKAYLFKSGYQPWGSGMSRGSGDFTVVTIAKTADLDHGIIWAQGSTGTSRGFGLVTVGADKVAVRSFSSDSTWTTEDILTVTVADATTQYHVYTLVYTDANKTFALYVDDADAPAGSGTVKDSASSGFPKTDFQFGSLNGGVKYDMTQGYGARLDEFRLYQQALTVSQIKRICGVDATISWGTAGRSGQGVATTSDGKFGLSSWTFNFAQATNIVNGGVNTNRIVRIQKIRLMQRADKTSKPTTATLKQGTVESVATAVASYDDDASGMTLYGSDGAAVVTRGYHEFTFDGLTEFDPTVNIQLVFDNAKTGCSVMKPANTVLVSSGWSPVIEITALQFGDGAAYSATIGASMDFSDISTWSPSRPAAFSASDTITFKATAAAATLTLDEDLAIGKLSVTSEAGKLLTFKQNDSVGIDIGTLDFSKAVDGVGFDAKSGFTADALLLTYARTHDEKFTFYGSGANGALLDYGTDRKNYTFSGHYIFEGGTHVFQNACETGAAFNFGACATADNPTLWAKDNTTLYFKSRNPCGYNNGTANTDGIVRIGNGATVVAQNSSAGTWYWAQQFYFEDGSTLAIETAGDNFRVVGGDTAGAPQFYMPNSGVAAITGLDDNYFCLPNNAGSGAAAEIGADATLSISVNMKTLADGKPFGKYGEGTLALTGDLSAFGAAIAVSNGVLKLAPTAYLKSTATLAVAEGAKLILDAGSGEITNLCQITNGGTIEVAGGTVIFMEGTFNGTVTTSGSGKILYGYTTDVNMLGEFPIPEGKTADQIRLFDKGGNAVPFTVDGDTLKFEWQITGAACWWDYEFEGNGKNIGTEGTELSWDGDRPYKNNEYVTDETTGEQSLRIPSRPYRVVSSWPETATFVMYGTMVCSNKTYQIGFGSTYTGSKYTIFLATDDVSQNTVNLCLSYEKQAPTVLCKLTVPNAQSAKHLYAFVLKVEDGKTVVNTYLDDHLLQPYTHGGDQIVLGPGFQIGSGFGGIASGYSNSKEGDPALLDWLRVYDTELSEAAMQEYAKKYPYESNNGKATRTIGADGMWKQAEAWTQWSQEGIATAQDAPDADTVVSVTMTGDATIEMNLDAQANYEQFTVDGSGTLKLTQGADAVVPIVVGRSTIGADVTVDYRCFKFGGNVDVADGKSLTFDFASLDLGTCWADETIVLTGAATLGEGATVSAANLVQKPCRTATFALNGQTQQYELKIVVSQDPFIGTVAAGSSTCTWTWSGNPITESDVDAHPEIDIWKEGPGTLSKELAKGRNYIVNAGTFKTTNAAEKTSAVTVKKGATFDFNGSIDGYVAVTLNGGSLVNNGAVMGTGKRQMTGITLEAASTIGGTGDFGLISSQYKANMLDLGGYVLTKTGTNTFYLCNTTISNGGSVKIQSGAVEVFKTSSFAGGTINNGGVLRIDDGAIFTVKTVAGGTIENAGTLAAVSLSGTVSLSGDGTYEGITLSGSATVDVATRRELPIGGTGKINVVLTDEEIQKSGHICLFVPMAEAAITLGRVVDALGNDLTYKYRLDDGMLYACQAKIGTVLYETLILAIEAVQADQVIDLIAPAQLFGSVTNVVEIDLKGNRLDCGTVNVSGSLRITDSNDIAGPFVVNGVVTVFGNTNSCLVVNVPAMAGGGRIAIESGRLVNEYETLLNGMDLSIGCDGCLDLSTGISLYCRNFTSSGAVIGSTAMLVVDGILTASAPVRIPCLTLTGTATVMGTGLEVSRKLVLGNSLRFRYDSIKEGLRVATAPADTDFATTALFVNDATTIEYEFYMNSGDTALRIKKTSGIVADVRLSVDPDTNEVNRVDFESAVISGSVNLHGGDDPAEVSEVVLIARSSDGTVVTQKVNYVGADGSFSQEVKGLDAGGSYNFSADVAIVISGKTQDVSTVGQDVDFVSSRHIVRNEDGTGGWIYEDADTFAGINPGTGQWYGTNGVAWADSDSGIICFFAEDWSRTVEFQPDTMSLDMSYSTVKDLHFHMALDCPGFYTYEEPWPSVPDGASAAFTIVADEDDSCRFAVASNGTWAVISRDVFAPELGTRYEVLVRLDGVASNIQYSVIVDGDIVRLATCPAVDSKDVSLDLAGSGSVKIIEGIGQNAHLAQVGEEEFWTIGEAVDAAGGTNNIIPLWWSRYTVAGDGGAFRIWDPNGYLQIFWRRWHHWALEDGTYRFISGNNWIEYADASGVVECNDGSFLVTNEVGLAWVAEQSTNRWFKGRVELGASLDLASKNWTPIAQFTGTFDGRGHAIAGLNNVHVIYTNLLGSAGYYFGGPTNDWGYMAYGLFSSATNAAFANLTFEDVAISNVSDSTAVLLGVHAGGDLVVTNVEVGSGRVFGEGRAVAGLLTVGGNENGDVIVACNTNRATIAGAIATDLDGGNVAQILAGTAWDAIFLGEVVATNNVGEGGFDVEWTNRDGYHFELPVCNFAAAVSRITAEGYYRRFVEANEPSSIPIDPVHRTARMLAGTLANGADNIAGWWMDTITATPSGGHIDIVGKDNVIDTWEPVLIDRDLSFNLNSNFVYTVYDNDTFTIADGVSATVSNGVVYVGKDYEAFGGDVAGLTTNNVKVVKLDADFYERTVMVVDGMFLSVSEAISYLHAGSCIELFEGEGLTIDVVSNAVLLDGNKIAELSEYQSLTNAVGGDGTVAYMVRLNEKAVPDYDFELTGADAGSGTVQINVVGARAGLYYAVQHKASLVEKWSEPAKTDWVLVESDGSIIQFSLPASESSGFYRIKVTDYLPNED